MNGRTKVDCLLKNIRSWAELNGGLNQSGRPLEPMSKVDTHILISRPSTLKNHLKRPPSFEPSLSLWAFIVADRFDFGDVHFGKLFKKDRSVLTARSLVWAIQSDSERLPTVVWTVLPQWPSILDLTLNFYSTYLSKGFRYLTIHWPKHHRKRLQLSQQIFWGNPCRNDFFAILLMNLYGVLVFKR